MNAPPPRPASLLTIRDEGVVRIAAFSAPTDLTADGASELRAAMETIAVGRAALVLDLGNVRFIDSSGVGTVVAVHRQLSRTGGELRIARPSREASTAFSLVRLHRLIEIHETVGDAIASFGRTA